MPDPTKLRDSTQIVLPHRALEGIREDLESKFILTLHCEGNELVRIIGSPVEIKDASNFLSRHGVSIP